MRFVRAVLDTVVGLFVSDWVQSAVVLAIVALGWLAFSRVGAPALVVMVALLAGQLVWFARVEATR